MSRSRPSTAATPSKLRTRRSVVIADMAPSSACKPATVWPVFSVLVSPDDGARPNSSLDAAVGRGELGPDARQAVAQLGRIDDLDGRAEPRDLACERLDVMPAQFELDATVGSRRADPHAVPQDPPAHRHERGLDPRPC